VAASSEATFRVYRLDNDLRKLVKDDRIAHEETAADQVERIAGEQLPALVDGLLALGFRSQDEARPIRLPVTSAVLDSLRAASEITGIPAAHLLVASFSAATGGQKKAKSPRSRKAASKKKTSQRKAPRRAKKATRTRKASR